MTKTKTKVNWFQKIYYIYHNSKDLLEARYMGSRKTNGQYKHIIAVTFTSRNGTSEEWEDVVFIDDYGMQAGGLGIHPSIINETIKTKVYTIFYKRTEGPECNEHIYTSSAMNKKDAEALFDNYNSLDGFKSIQIVENVIDVIGD